MLIYRSHTFYVTYIHLLYLFILFYIFKLFIYCGLFTVTDVTYFTLLQCEFLYLFIYFTFLYYLFTHFLQLNVYVCI